MLGRPIRRTVTSVCKCCIVAALASVASTASAQILVVLSDESAVYEDVANELKTRLASLREGRLRIDVVTTTRASTFEDRGNAPYELVVTVGLAAAQSVVAQMHGAASASPTLCLLVPRQDFDELAKAGATGAERRVSAVFVEQPIARQLDLIALALPGKSRIGAVFGPTSAALAEDVRDRARERGFVLNRADVTDASGVYAALQTVLRDSDLLLALPDPVAINASTARGVLVAGYRAQVPVVGFSRGFVDAGSLLAVYSTAHQQGRQGAEIAQGILAGKGALPAPQYPRYFTVAVNFFAARSLGLRIEDESTLASALADRIRNSSEPRKPSMPRGNGEEAPRRP